MKKIITSANCLAITNPDIAKQWHPTKNFPLTPFDVTFGISKKVWWKCDIADDHEWEASLNNRTGIGAGCACCSGHKAVLSNCLVTTHPELLKQWHPTKNLPLTLFNIVAGSNKKVWWKCNKEKDHEWQSSILSKTNGRDCPCCAGRKVVSSNCLATIHPEITKQWHPTKNLPLTPFDVISGSVKKIWWKCYVADDHEWESSIVNRTRGRNCPCCGGDKVVLSNCLATTHPELSKQWHPTKNLLLTPFDIVAGSNKKVWWKCDKADDHEWKSILSSRVNGTGCPCCIGVKVVLSNCLTTTHPEIVKQWHPIKNLPLSPLDVTSGRGTKVWWKCNKENDHEWQTNIYNMVNRNSCPCCSGHKVVLSNCLVTTHPELLKQWHPTKNLLFTPYDVTFGSDKKVWWKCDKTDNHEWYVSICSRTTGNGCPYCYESFGETKIKNTLDDMAISYEREKRFNDCKYKYRLSFDFYLPQHNALIEYDGKQHFIPIEYFGGIKSLKLGKIRDKIKNEFAIKNNIPLLRIHYTQFDTIEKELIFFISKLK